MLGVPLSTEAVTSILPNLGHEQKSWELTKVEVINNGQRLSSRGTRPERARKRLTVGLRQRLLNSLRGGLAIASHIGITNNSTQSAFRFHDILPHGLCARQKPGRRERRRIWLAPELAK